MKILGRYISITVIKAILLVTVLFLGIDTFITFVGELGDIGDGNYGLWQAAQYVFLNMPLNIYNLFSIIGLLGSLIGLGILASNHELAIMRASGIDLKQIVWAVMRAALIVMIFVTLIGELLGPRGEYIANVHKAYDTSSVQASRLSSGMWAKDKNSFIYIQKVVSDSRLEGITIYQFDDMHQLLSVSHAAYAIYRKNGWQLQNVIVSSLQSNNVATQTVATLPWAVSISPKLLAISSDEPSETSLLRLYELIKYQYINKLQPSTYSLVFWQRIFQPFATLMMIFLAIPFIFGPLRSVPMGLRILTGVLVGFSFYLLGEFFGPLCLVYQIPPIVGAAAPIFLFAIVGLVLMRRVR